MFQTRTRESPHRLCAAAMATRRKPTSKPSEIPPEVRSVEAKPPHPDPLAPPKFGLIIPVAAAFFLSFFYLVFVKYRIEPDLRRSIAINAAMSFGAFVLAVRMIPVAARYVLRRNLYGFDINKKGTPQGTIKVSVFSFSNPVDFLNSYVDFGLLL